jgi:hypothetical protein
MKTTLRTIAATLVGLVLVFALVIAVEVFSSVVHPLPEDFDGSQQQMCQHVERYPAWVLAVVIPAWAATALVGVWIAQRFGNLVSSAIVGLLVLAALVFNISMLPYPLWFEIGMLLAAPVAMFAGIRWARRGKPAA